MQDHLPRPPVNKHTDTDLRLVMVMFQPIFEGSVVSMLTNRRADTTKSIISLLR